MKTFLPYLFYYLDLRDILYEKKRNSFINSYQNINISLNINIIVLLVRAYSFSIIDSNSQRIYVYLL